MKSLFSKLKVPVVQAPMAGVTSAEFVAEVSNCGALGSLGAGYMQPKAIEQSIDRIRSLSKKPFNVNLFIPPEVVPNVDLTEMQNTLKSYWEELSDEPYDSSPISLPSFEEQISVILEKQVPVFSFTFGTLSREWIERLHAAGTYTVGTATTPDEALMLQSEGVDAVVLQGLEAGGHRGGFSNPDPYLPLKRLLDETDLTIPTIAAGGIMTREHLEAALDAGATAVQMGTAFLTCSECPAHPTYKEALLKKPYRNTTLTRAFSGKDARSIETPFIKNFEKEPLPYPIQHALTAKLRKMAAEQGRADMMALWAGERYPECCEQSVRSLVKKLIRISS